MIDLATNEPVATRDGVGKADAAAASKNDLVVAVANQIRWFKLPQLEPSGTVEVGSPITGLALRDVADGEPSILVGYGDGKLETWQLGTEERTSLTAHEQTVTAVAALPFKSDDSEKSATWATADAAGNIKLWSDHELVRELEHHGPVVAVSVAHDGGELISVGEEGTIRWWNLADGKPLHNHTRSIANRGVIDRASRAVTLAQQQKQNAEADKKSSDERLKKEAEAVTKAEEELKKAEEAIPQKEEELKTKKESLTAKMKEVDAAEAKLAAAQRQLDELKPSENDADASGKEAEAAGDAGDTDKRKEAEQAVKGATEARDAAREVLAKSEKEVTAAEEAVKSAMSDRDASQGLLERNRENHARSEEQLAVYTAALMDRSEALSNAEGNLKGLNEAPIGPEEGIVSAIIAVDRVIVLRVDGDLEVYGLDGSVWDRVASPLLQAGLLASSTDRVIGRGEEGELVEVGLFGDWDLARTIGDPDDASQLIDRVVALDFDPTGTRLVSGGGEPSRSGELKMWNVEDGSLLREWPDAHSDTVFSVRISPDGATVASGSADRFAKTFSVETGELGKVFEGHTHYVQGVSWRGDGRLLATAGADKAVKLWDPLTAEQRQTITDAKKEITAVQFLGLDDRVVYATGAGQLRSSQSDGKKNDSLAQLGAFLHALDATSDGSQILAAGEDRTVRVWSKDGKLLGELPP